MTKPHKWAKEIKAWADGATIQFWGFDEWVDVEEDETPEWNEFSLYRVHPEYKEPQYLYVYATNGEVNYIYDEPRGWAEDFVGKIKLEDE